MLYLFHLAVALKLLKSITSKRPIPSTPLLHALRWDAIFFGTFLFWYVLSIAWAENIRYAIEYCVYILFAILMIFYTIQTCSNETRLNYAYKFIFLLVAFELGAAVLEGLGVLRLPFSQFSPYYSYFGREANDLSVFSAQAQAYLYTMPTGFFQNPNNLAAFLGLILPFFCLHRNWIVKLLGSISIIYVVYMCGARAALISCGAVIVICAFVWGGFSGKISGIAAAIAAAMLGTGILNTIKGSSDLRLAEVGSLGQAIDDLLGGLSGNEPFSQTSTGARAQLIRDGLDALWDSSGIGVGAGGSKTIQEQSYLQIGNLTSMHNFWVELLVEGGVIFGLVFAAWYASFIFRLFRVAKFSQNEQLRFYGKALFTGFVGFILGAVGPSSVIYMLPMWMLVGVGLAVIRIDEAHAKRPAAREFHHIQLRPPRLEHARTFHQDTLR